MIEHKRRNLALIILLTIFWSGASRAEGNSNVDDAVEFLKAACVLGEEYKLKISGDAGLKFLRPGAKGELLIEKKDIKGFVEGLSEKVKSEQADKIRECMRPYIRKIIDGYLGTGMFSNTSYVDMLEERSNVSQQIQYLRVSASRMQLVGDEAHVTLLLQDVNEKHGLAIALKAQYSDGIADFWKFFPRPSLAELTDNNGNKYVYKHSSGLGFARQTEDWMILEPKGEHAVTFVFRKEGKERHGNAFILSVDIWLVWKTHEDKQIKSAYTIYLNGIK